MLQREFQERVKMEVSVSEFDAINQVYMKSDLNKDEFCKMWIKMNKSRVEEARVQVKKREEEGLLKDRLFDIYSKTIGKSWEIYNLTAGEFFTKAEMRFLESLGYVRKDSVSRIGYQLAKYLGI